MSFTFSFQGTQPVAGGEIQAAPLSDTLNHLITNLNSGVLGTTNVDDTEVALLGVAQTITAQWTFSADVILQDNVNLTFGTGSDATIDYDGTNLVISPAVVGSGDLVVTGASIEFEDNEGVTLGTGNDATVQYDGTNLLVNAQAVGSGALVLTGNLELNNASGPALNDEAVGTTNPTVLPDKADDDTGIGGDGANTLDLITGGASRINIDGTGAVTKATSPAFQAVSASVANVTGDGTNYTVVFGASETFDRGADFDGTSTFTAPVTGIYELTYVMAISGITAAETRLDVAMVTSNRTYNLEIADPTGYDMSGFVRKTYTVLADMDAGDTATVLIDVTNGTKVVDLDANNYFMGHLVA